MIRLFRKIRQQLLSETKYPIYLLYAGGEILLVVLGILIALQIDNWNEDKKDRITEQQYLLALREEFIFNDEELERVSLRNKTNADNMVKLVNHMGPDEFEINEEELGGLLRGSLSNEIQFNPSQGVLDEIISSGKLGMFSSAELKFALSSWSGRLYRVRVKEQELSRIRYITIDIIRNEGNLRMALGSFIEELGIEKARFKKGNLPLLRSTIFEGHMMGAVTMSLNLYNHHFPGLDKEIDKILVIIEDQIH
jgi:hypothetical protein